MDEWDWHRVLDVNLTGVFLMTQSVGRLMRGQGKGAIINLSTLDQESGRNEAAFVTTMHGLIGFTRQAARELNPHGIQVHDVKDTAETIVTAVLDLLEEQS
jgi:NAD(P)-dependent dehydrogenase (short-subunit alcohol dehydrogenase family)